MGSFLDVIKQGLRNLGRAEIEPPPRVPQSAAQRDPTHSAQRLRTELDATRPSESAGGPRLETPKPPSASTASRVRKAVLSKARRGALYQSSSVIWGTGPEPKRGLFDDSSTQDQRPLLTGATLAAGRSSPMRPVSPARSDSALQGSTLFPASPSAEPCCPVRIDTVRRSAALRFLGRAHQPPFLDP